MRKLAYILLPLLLAFASCERLEEEDHGFSTLPEGSPAMLQIGFGHNSLMPIDVSTKAEASAVDEARVHDIYVLIFNNSDGRKIYGRYFSFEHQTSNLAALDASPNEGWWVENKTMTGVTPAVSATTGVVKVSTETCADARIILLANVTNAIYTLGGSDDPIGFLNGLSSFDELHSATIKLEQHVVNRKDLFLMMGELDGVNTGEMVWGTLAPARNYSEYKLYLRTLDAKVKFLIKCNSENISNAVPVEWQVCSTPDQCYLFEDYASGAAPEGTVYFDSEPAYFEGKETLEGEEWYVFSFYMLESRHEKRRAASSYQDREKQDKTDTGESGYHGGGNFVSNGAWTYAGPHATYVKFDMVLTLTARGISAIGADVANALTTDTIYTVHLGDFVSSGVTTSLDDYNTFRSHYYTYKITINNSTSIYAEVENDNERQPGQEGFLLLTNDEIVNADSHYEYHSLTFNYNEDMSPEKFSWYVKTPFGEGGPEKIHEDPEDLSSPIVYEADGLDYKWVMFSVNNVVDGAYATERRAFPGVGEYDGSWKPSLGTPHPLLMDINQLIMYIFDQTEKKKNDQANDFLNNKINVTIFIDEYYYTENPLTGETDPDLWRKFVNAKPREMHILSDARPSRDRQSDVILSSHSIVQQSIQSIYNIYEPSLRNLWGTEHIDEMKEKAPDGWPYWPYAQDTADIPGTGGRSGPNNDLGKENGRYNSAIIWGLAKGTNPSQDILTEQWDTYLDYTVDNNVPELNSDWQSLAYSCLSRNRDNNGNGTIDREEMRWYMAASRQLIGMWVGNESLTTSARLYQPSPGQWRAHVLSSTEKQSCWTEEGAAFSTYMNDVRTSGEYHTWSTVEDAAKAQSVRCLRNIGTYDDNGETKDITYAPYATMVQQYYTVETHNYGTPQMYYTLSFDRLNTKSIREYTDADLPYHDQHSLTNRVYVKMSTQKLEDDVDFDATQIQTINNSVTALGYNPYCPPGYRFPNHTEMLVMSQALDNWYFEETAVIGTKYGSAKFPTRTYYDRGYYGSLKTETEPWYIEKNKVGWAKGYGSNPVHLVEYNKSDITHTRCIKDENMTGNISGTTSMEENVLYCSDYQSITFNFQSTASALSYVSLKLGYMSHSGNYREIDLPVEKMPTGLQYRETQTIIIPSLSELGLELSDLPVNATLQTEIRNASGVTKTVPIDVKIIDHLKEASLDFPAEADPAKGYVIDVNMALRGHNAKFSQARLLWKESTEGEYHEYDLGIDLDFDRSAHRKLYLSDFIGTAAIADDSFKGKTYQFKLDVACSDGASAHFQQSLKVLPFELCYDPNPAPAGGWTTANSTEDISRTFDWTVSGLDFAGGDRLDIGLDLSNCVFVFKSNEANSLGIDNILTISTQALADNINNNTLHLYYPSATSVSANPGDLRVIMHAGTWAQFFLNNWDSSIKNPSSLRVTLDKDGIWYNGKLFTEDTGNWLSAVKGNLTGASTLHIGSKEGKHHTRAKYCFVRIIGDDVP